MTCICVRPCQNACALGQKSLLTGTRTPVSRVRIWYPDRLDYEEIALQNAIQTWFISTRQQPFLLHVSSTVGCFLHGWKHVHRTRASHGIVRSTQRCLRKSQTSLSGFRSSTTTNGITRRTRSRTQMSSARSSGCATQTRRGLSLMQRACTWRRHARASSARTAHSPTVPQFCTVQTQAIPAMSHRRVQQRFGQSSVAVPRGQTRPVTRRCRAALAPTAPATCPDVFCLHLRMCLLPCSDLLLSARCLVLAGRPGRVPAVQLVPSARGRRHAPPAGHAEHEAAAAVHPAPADREQAV